MQVTFTIPAFRTLIRRWRWAALASAALALALFADVASSAGTMSITVPDQLGNVGQHSSLALDAAGFPVVSYYDLTNGDLKVLHCSDANCLRGGESTTSPDTGGDVGQYTSLELDASGYPVISYHDLTNGDLKVMHCNDANCASGGESISSPDTAGDAGWNTSLELDTSGHPVVSYMDLMNYSLRVLHCDDPNCAGGGESIASPDAGNTRGFISLELDAAGYPVISYYGGALFSGDLKVLHCDDVNCAGGGESIRSPDVAGNVGGFTSLALDASGFPVVSYHSFSDGNLTVLHCDDPDCASGGDSITVPDAASDFGQATSLSLDGAGFPVISYQDDTNGALKVLHCDNANCAGGGGSITSPDTTGSVGPHSSLELDALGRPVVTYWDATNGDLKVLHCGTPLCANSADTQNILITSLSAGWPAGLMGGACYDVDPPAASPPFTVCDNETGAGVDTATFCTKDGSPACTDDDPAFGSIRVALLAGTYDVTTSSVPGHIADNHLEVCDPSQGVDAKCAFTHTPVTRPWFPWDVNGDGSVASQDIFQSLGHFGRTK